MGRAIGRMLQNHAVSSSDLAVAVFVAQARGLVDASYGHESLEEISGLFGQRGNRGTASLRSLTRRNLRSDARPREAAENSLQRSDLEIGRIFACFLRVVFSCSQGLWGQSCLQMQGRWDSRAFNHLVYEAEIKWIREMKLSNSVNVNHIFDFSSRS